MITAAKHISVVIPAFNRIAVLRRAIDSVLAQTCPPGELIVVDDGSDDSTRELIASCYADTVKYIYQANHGVSHARNTGIKMAKGKWIALLDSDDEWHPEKLQLQLEALTRHPEYEFCHTNEIWIRNGIRVNAMNKHEKSGGYIFVRCLPLCVISPSSALIKKSVFDRIGFFDEGMPACEDYDLWLRYCSASPVLYIETPLINKYGGHEDQLSRKHWGMDRFRLHALKKIIASQELSTAQFDAAVDMFHSKLNILMKGADKHRNNELKQACRSMLETVNSAIAAKREKIVGSKNDLKICTK